MPLKYKLKFLQMVHLYKIGTLNYRLLTIDATYTQTDITVFGYDSTWTANANSTPGSRLKCTPVEAKASSNVSTSVNAEWRGNPHTYKIIELLNFYEVLVNLSNYNLWFIYISNLSQVPCEM